MGGSIVIKIVCQLDKCLFGKPIMDIGCRQCMVPAMSSHAINWDTKGNGAEVESRKPNNVQRLKT